MEYEMKYALSATVLPFVLCKSKSRTAKWLSFYKVHVSGVMDVLIS